MVYSLQGYPWQLELTLRIRVGLHMNKTMMLDLFCEISHKLRGMN